MDLWNKLTTSCLFVLGLAALTSGCDDGLVSYNGNCYFFSHDMENWMEAEEMCKVLFGGLLVEITDAAENNFINQEVHDRLTVTDRYWMGATDVVKEGHWVWKSTHTDVKGPSYVNLGESNTGGNENCLEVMSNAIWNDVACASPRHYICEVNPENMEVIG